MIGLALLDWAVIAAYGAAVVGIGWWSHRRQLDSDDYFLGGRRLRWWVVGVSLIATSFSSVSLIGGTGFGFDKGMAWLQLQIGDLLAIGVVCVVFLPMFAGMRLTTAYEYLERRFGVTARTVASALFIAQTLLRAAILVYAPALVLATILDWPVELAIVVAAAAAVLYSAFGGIAAVVWTDLIQMAVILFAVVYCVLLVAGDVPGGFPAMLARAKELGRLGVVTPSADPSTPFNLLGATVPYAVLALSLFGTGQQAVQRFLSCTDLGAARRAALTGWTVGTLSLALTLFLGTCLAAWASLVATPLEGIAGDQVLPAFIEHRLPAGVAGLVLAAIFAASMSSLDSAIHSMSTAGIVDFYRRFSRRPTGPEDELRFARRATVAFGVLATLGALYAAAREDAHLLEILVTWLGYFAGPLLGLFLLGLLTRRATEAGALIGLGTAFAAVVGLVLLAPDGLWRLVHRLWLAPWSCLLAVSVGWLASLVGPAPRRAESGLSGGLEPPPGRL